MFLNLVFPPLKLQRFLYLTTVLGKRRINRELDMSVNGKVDLKQKGV